LWVRIWRIAFMDALFTLAITGGTRAFLPRLFALDWNGFGQYA
jgi:hypothetical protein